MQWMEFDGFAAALVAQQIVAANPGTQLTVDYLLDVIRWSCAGDAYWFGHHSAFDRYLAQLGKERIVCGNCRENAIVDEGNSFCGAWCVEDYYVSH